LPLGLAVAALSVPLARLFFERGQVAAQQAMLLGSVWGVYALSLPFLGPYRVVQTFFYSVREAKPAVVLHATLAASSVALDLVLVWSLGATGLALSFVLSCSLVTVIGLIWMARSAGDPSHPSGEGLNWRRLAGSAWRLGFVSAAMAAALLATSKGLDPLVGGAGHWGLALNLGVSALSGAAVFVGLGAILHLEAVVVAWKVVKEKWLVGTQPGY
jgi:peptidoglycan biosynthesis protein MviN/MurJ (putative lipid II flippase)